MAKYIISKITVGTTSTGKTKATCSLIDASVGHETPEVTLWGDFPNFASLSANSEVSGNLVSKDYNGKIYQTLYPDTPKPAGAKMGGAGIAKAQERKAENIAEAQTRKEQGIQLAATMRDATLLTVEWIKGNAPIMPSDDDIKAKWLEWRRWLDTNFGSGQPF
jgi:hypothetical protein